MQSKVFLVPPEPGQGDHALGDLGAGSVGLEEWATGKIFAELRMVDAGALANHIELFH